MGQIAKLTNVQHLLMYGLAKKEEIVEMSEIIWIDAKTSKQR